MPTRRSGRQCCGVDPAVHADCAAGSCRESDKRSVGAAAGAAGEMRQIPGEPQELELEGEREWIEHGPVPPSCSRSFWTVQNVEEAHERVERTGILVMLDEQPQNGLEPDVAHRRSVGIARQALMRPEEVDARHGPELAAALVELNVDVAERLEPCPET